jgi:hypothetical protein
MPCILQFAVEVGRISAQFMVGSKLDGSVGAGGAFRPVRQNDVSLVQDSGKTSREYAEVIIRKED